MMDDFFDCLNVRSRKEHKLKRKPFLAPYTSVSDPRFDFLENEFLNYFKEWQKSIADRQGNFTANAHSKMFISRQTDEGIQLTVHSMVAVCKYLLQDGMEYVLTERFCQDPVEEYFGSQRSLGRRCDNPDVFAFGYHDNTIRIQRHVGVDGGNTRGSRKTGCKWLKVSDDSLPKRKRQRKKK